MARQFGSVIVFKQGLNKAECEKLIAALVDDGAIEDPRRPKCEWGPAFDGVNEYDDMGGQCGPVWYIP